MTRRTRQAGAAGGGERERTTSPLTPEPAVPVASQQYQQQHQQQHAVQQQPVPASHPPAKQRKTSSSSTGKAVVQPPPTATAEGGSSFPIGADVPRPPEPKRKRSSSSASGVPSAASSSKATGPEAALLRNGLEVGTHICNVCHDLLVGAHVMAPCRHVVCGDCLFSLVLRLVAGTPSAVHIPFLCAVDECGVVVSGMAKWARADAEAAAKVKSLSTSTYAHRSLEIRQTMFAHKPTLESVLRAIPAFQLDYFADAGPNPGEKLVARPKSSSAASASSAGPSSTPVRARPPPGPVPSHTYRTPQQQMSGGYAGSLPTPQSDFASRFGGQGGGAYASTQRAQATATSRGAKGEQVRRSDGHGAEREDEKIWEGPLVIPAHGGGEVIVFMEGYVYSYNQPYIPAGLLNNALSLRGYQFVARPGPIQPHNQVMRLVQMDEKTAQTRRESLPPEEREKAKPAADLIQQLGQTIATRGAIAVRLPGAPDFQDLPHLIFDMKQVERPDGSPEVWLVAMVNPAAESAIAQLTGNIAARAPSRTQGVSPTAVSTLPPLHTLGNSSDRMHDYNQMQYQQQYRMSQQHLPSPISADPANMYQQYPTHHQVGLDPSRMVMSPSAPPPYMHPRSATPQYRQATSVALPPIAPVGPSVQQTLHELSSIPQQLQYPPLDQSQGSGSSEFLTFPPETPDLDPSVASSGTVYTEEERVLNDGYAQRRDDSQHVQDQYAAGGDAQQQQQEGDHVGGGGHDDYDGTTLEAVMAGFPGALREEPEPGTGWKGTITISALGTENQYVVDRIAAGPVELRDDLRSRFDPVLFPPSPIFAASNRFDEILPAAEDRNAIGRITFEVEQQSQLMDLVRSCETAESYNQPLLAQIRTTDRAVEAQSDATLLLRLGVDRSQGPQPVLIAGVYLVGGRQQQTSGE